MSKKYVVRLTDEERAVCEATVKKEKGKSEKLRRAVILLKADIDGPSWNDEKISVASRGRWVSESPPKTIELGRELPPAIPGEPRRPL